MRTSALRGASRAAASAAAQLAGSSASGSASASASAWRTAVPAISSATSAAATRRRGPSRTLSSSASSAAAVAADAVQSERDAQFLRHVSVGDPQRVLASALQHAVVHTPLSYLHPSTRDVPRSERFLVPLSSHVFGIQPRSDILHAAVVYYLDSLRAGTASTKTRGEVAYSGRKLRPQKGSGQARLGTRGNPMLKGGGVAHGPKPRDFSTKLNRRVRELALRSALSARWRNHDLHVVPSFGGVDKPPGITGPMRRLLGSKGWDRALFLTAPRSPAAPARAYLTSARPSAADPIYSTQQIEEHHKLIANFKRAVGNIPNTEVIELDKLPEEAVRRTLQRKGRRAALEVAKRPGELHAYQVLRYPKVICDLGAVEWLEEKLGGAAWHSLEDASGSSSSLLERGREQGVGVDPVTGAHSVASVPYQAEAEDEDFARGAPTTITEMDAGSNLDAAADPSPASPPAVGAGASGEAETRRAADHPPPTDAELSREADDILRSAGVDVTAEADGQARREEPSKNKSS